MAGEYEPNLNSELCALFAKAGMRAEKEKRIGGQKRADIFVRHDRHAVIVECKLFGPGKRDEAVRQAAERLEPLQLADSAIAVVYPKGCTAEMVDMDLQIDYAVVGRAHARSRIRQRTLDGSQQELPRRRGGGPRWERGTVRDLVAAAKRVAKDLGDPDALVRELDAALDDAVEGLAAGERKRLAGAMDLPSRNGDWRPAAKRSLLVLASAAMFHGRLGDQLAGMRPSVDARTGGPFKGRWPPAALADCGGGANAAARLRASWSLILAVDYRPIFAAAVKVLDALDSPAFARSVGSIVRWARDAVGSVGGLRHDVLGRIFHRLLEGRYDGSFYTSVPASIILAGLAIRGRRDVPRSLGEMRVIDAACGTGTLLMAAAERIKDVRPAGYSGKTIIEDVLVGIDINDTALHIAATTLGLLSPATRFERMNILQAEFGATDGGAAAGSLEQYGRGGTLPVREWGEKHRARQIDSGAPIESLSYAGRADLVIMNPPFTRNDLRHQQLGPAARKKVSDREAELFGNSPVRVGRASSGPMFLLLAAHLCGPGGTVALVLPLVAATNSDTLSTRRHLAEEFHIETVVVACDPERYWFSENTTIPEMLVVLRRRARAAGGGERAAGGGAGRAAAKRPTRVYHLTRNPGTAVEAEAVAGILRRGAAAAGGDILASDVPHKAVADGDWSRVQFLSQRLYDMFAGIAGGRLFAARRLPEVADIAYVGRQVRGAFEEATLPGKGCVPSVYGHDTGSIRTIRATPSDYIRPRKGMEGAAERAWARRGHLLFPERVRTNLAHVAVLYADAPTVGSAWAPVVPRPPGMEVDGGSDGGSGTRGAGRAGRRYAEAWSKAMAAYMNSTAGIVSLIGVQDPKAFAYPRWSLSNLERLRVPALADDSLRMLAAAFDACARLSIGRWRAYDDPVRTGLDRAVADALGVDRDALDAARYDLSREPACTNRRHGAAAAAAR